MTLLLASAYPETGQASPTPCRRCIPSCCIRTSFFARSRSLCYKISDKRRWGYSLTWLDRTGPSRPRQHHWPCHGPGLTSFGTLGTLFSAVSYSSPHVRCLGQASVPVTENWGVGVIFLASLATPGLLRHEVSDSHGISPIRGSGCLSWPTCRRSASKYAHRSKRAKAAEEYISQRQAAHSELSTPSPRPVRSFSLSCRAHFIPFFLEELSSRSFTFSSPLL